jgi:transposase-like protein
MANGTGNLTKLAGLIGDENAARELLESLRWPDGAACPHCGGADPYRLNTKPTKKNPGRIRLWKCSQCKRQFNVTVGTVFEGSHVPVVKWLMAIHLMAASKKGMSAHQLHRMLGVTYRSAWFIFHRLRYAMASNEGFFVKLSGTVEADETYIGGRRRIGPTNAEDRARLAVGRPGPKDKKLWMHADTYLTTGVQSVVTNTEMIERIKAWQEAWWLHPLTCGNDSSHTKLEPAERDGKVVLVCRDCDYVQEFIPPITVGPTPPNPFDILKR